MHFPPFYPAEIIDDSYLFLSRKPSTFPKNLSSPDAVHNFFKAGSRFLPHLDLFPGFYQVFLFVQQFPLLGGLDRDSIRYFSIYSSANFLGSECLSIKAILNSCRFFRFYLLFYRLERQKKHVGSNYHNHALNKKQSGIYGCDAAVGIVFRRVKNKTVAFVGYRP